MLNRLKPKSEFTKNVLTLMTGTTIAQAIPIAISPILTRLYTPEDFGVFALFFAIASIFGSIANGRYELAIMLPKKDEDAINIMALGFIINVVLSLFLLLVVLIFHDYIVKLLNNKEISPWLYFIPLSVFLMGIFNLLNYFNNRMKQYKDLAKANVYKSIGMAMVQLSLGLIKAGAIGLISGRIFSQIISNTKLFFNIKKLNLFRYIKKVKIIALAKRYINFPIFSLPSVIFNMLSQHLVNIFLTIIYDIKTLGYYSLVQRVLVIPSSLIGQAIGQVFFKQAIFEKHKNNNINRIFQKTIINLFVIALPIYIFLYFYIENIFAFVFGEKWSVAGGYAKILIFLYFIRFIVSSVSNMNEIFQKNHILLGWQVILFLLNLILLYCIQLYHLTFEQYLFLFNIVISIHYILLLIIMNSYKKEELVR